jgi:hypothetical protein
VQATSQAGDGGSCIGNSGEAVWEWARNEHEVYGLCFIAKDSTGASDKSSGQWREVVLMIMGKRYRSKREIATSV